MSADAGRVMHGGERGNNRRERYRYCVVCPAPLHTAAAAAAIVGGGRWSPFPKAFPASCSCRNLALPPASWGGREPRPAWGGLQYG